MEQLHKRQKITKESTVNDIASSISEISESIDSISRKYRTILKVNKAVVLYLQDSKERQKESNIERLQSELEETRID